MVNENIELRIRVYGLILQPHSQIKVAEILKVKPNIVSYHIKRLIKDRAIAESRLKFSGICNSKYYVKGINCMAYDRAVAEMSIRESKFGEGGSRGGSPASSNLDTPQASAIEQRDVTRIHNIQFKMTIQKFPEQDKINWEHAWVFSGNNARKTRLQVEGIGSVSIVEVRGKRNNTLQVSFPPILMQADRLLTKKAFIESKAVDVSNILSKQYGYRLGLVEYTSELEYAFREPSLDYSSQLPKDKEGKWWIDNSEGEGKAEWETKSAKLAEIKGNMPNEVLTLKERIGKIEENTDTVNAKLDRLHEDMTGLVGGVEKIAKGLDKVGGLLSKPAEQQPQPTQEMKESDESTIYR